ncbi:MAG: hypothetical protein ACYTG0_22500 [Planctomycetota bacterium]|jgi:hypothetical protein
MFRFDSAAALRLVLPGVVLAMVFPGASTALGEKAAAGAEGPKARPRVGSAEAGIEESSAAALPEKREPGSGNFLVVPITTELQRAHGKEYDKAELFVLVNATGAIREDDMQLDLAAVDLEALHELLLARASEKTDAGEPRDGIVVLNFYYFRPSTGVTHSRDPVTDFSSRLRDVTKRAGFPDAYVSIRRAGPDWRHPNYWRSLVAELATPPSEEAVKAESGVGDDQVKLYPVRTPLARFLFGDEVDCVIHIIPPIEEARAHVLDTMQRCLSQLKLQEKHCVKFLFTGKNLKEANYALRELCGEHVYRDLLGFKARIHQVR